ncbi:MAG: rRNA maturation RNase YbeY [Anaerolineae bacterium]
MSPCDVDVQIDDNLHLDKAERIQFCALVQAAAQAAFMLYNWADGDAALTVFLTDDDYVRQLNQQFRQLDEPTDVLSFPSGEPLPGMPEEVRYLGDIAMSLPYARRQAGHMGNPLASELQLLAVHGTLHLLGFDHTDSEEKRAMWAAQAAVLSRLGVTDIRIAGDNDGE